MTDPTKWPIHSEAGVLREVLPCSPDVDQRFATDDIVRRTSGAGRKPDAEGLQRQHGEPASTLESSAKPLSPDSPTTR